MPTDLMNLPLRRQAVTPSRYNPAMSYTVTLWCGCHVYVSCNPETRVAHSRVVEQRGRTCPVKRHETGARLWLWELLPDPRGAAQVAVQLDGADQTVRR